MFGNFKIYIIFIIFLILPLFCSATSNVRKRRRPNIDLINGIDQQTIIPDQLAIAAESNYQNAIQYEPEYDSKNNYRHGKLMIKYMNSAEEPTNSKYAPEQQHQEQQYSSPSDIINVSDTETAEEYVQKALEMHSSSSQNFESINPELNTISTSPRYDIFPKNSEQIVNDDDKEINPNYDQVTRSYDVHDYNEDNNNYGKSISYQTNPYTHYAYERKKYPINMKYYSDSSSSIKTLPLTGTVPASASQSSSLPSVQIPKEEIRKHIEQAVAKYMKEMEANGKIIKPSETQKQKVYYKYPEQSIDTNNKQYIGTSTSRTHNSYGPATLPSVKIVHPIKHSSQQSSQLPALGQLTSYKEHSYQPGNPLQETIENLNQNVEFIYKMKTRQPLKQTTKSIILPTKSLTTSNGITTNFDHSSVIKNFQGFDMSHVIQDDQHHQLQQQTQNKQKLLFNSDVYHDINSLPYKPEKLIKEPNLDYHGYGLEQGPSSSSSSSSNQYISLGDHLKNSEQISSSSNNNNNNEQTSIDAGYPIMNPYQYVLNKEQKYSETSLGGNGDTWTPHIPTADKENNNKINSHITTSLKGLDHDSYSPKYNNNPEGYGYQHNYNYKTIDPHHYHTTTKHPNRYFKRGKRGGSIGSNNNNNNITYKKKTNRGLVTKDIEANIALRPPPKI